VQHYDKTFDLNRLDAVDLIAVYWMGDAIAHVMISFGFQERDFVVFSIETRKEQGEGYSTLKGFFKQDAYEPGALVTHLSFDELRKRSYINPKAGALGDDPDFSRKIRQGLPRPGG